MLMVVGGEQSPSMKTQRSSTIVGLVGDLPSGCNSGFRSCGVLPKLCEGIAPLAATPEPNVTAFPSFGSSGHGLLSSAPLAVNDNVTVGVQQTQIVEAVVVVVAVPSAGSGQAVMMHFQHVLGTMRKAG